MGSPLASQSGCIWPAAVRDRARLSLCQPPASGSQLCVEKKQSSDLVVPARGRWVALALGLAIAAWPCLRQPTDSARTHTDASQARRLSSLLFRAHIQTRHSTDPLRLESSSDTHSHSLARSNPTHQPSSQTCLLAILPRLASPLSNCPSPFPLLRHSHTNIALRSAALRTDHTPSH